MERRTTHHNTTQHSTKDIHPSLHVCVQDRRPRQARRTARVGGVGPAMPPALAEGLRVRLLIRKWMDQFA